MPKVKGLLPIDRLDEWIGTRNVVEGDLINLLACLSMQTGKGAEHHGRNLKFRMLLNIIHSG